MSAYPYFIQDLGALKWDFRSVKAVYSFYEMGGILKPTPVDIL